MEIQKQIEDIVNEWIKSTDCFLVDIKISPSKVAVFIDKPVGVSLEECVSLSRLLNNSLEPDGVWESRELEVSSPGMDQPLKVHQQYLRRIGKDVKVITLNGLEHKGKLQSADETGIEILETISRKENKKKIISEVVHKLGYHQIKETKLILSFKN